MAPASPRPIAPALTGNQLQGPNYTRSLSDPRVQQKIPFAGHDDNLDRLIPAPGVTIDRRDYPYTQYDRNSVAMSLHQVHLRSPKRIPQEHDPGKLGRYYQAIKEFTLPPVAIPPQSYLYEFHFEIPEHQFIQLVKEEDIQGEHLPVSLFSSGSLRLRVRCCHMKKTHTSLSDTWVTTETTWPQHIFMELNNEVLSIPRKSHFSKDLPIEASWAAIANKNILKVSIPKISENREEPKPGWEFYIAIELIEILSHRDVLQMVRMHQVPADATREVIRTRLVGANGFSQQPADEDELMMLNELSIDLIDPFSRVMIKVPVRGKSCTHLECFDLETWLNSRLGKKSCNWCNNTPGGCSKCPNEPSFVDKWKCPLCLADARPYSLVIDEFLVQVRSQLEHQNLLQAKSILVSPDGTWKPKEQPADDDGDVDSEDDGNISTGRLSKAHQRIESGIEVIEID
ncbi:Zinc finger MIZ domain-containing protein 2 [Daldinia childiae]|uniref:Zinc finger MIZ domain-containing protein 2 n=1 Tax=Daldinia childiae TaxID=326645 RepID=UPI0014475C01|nr:Zinc finger MIZ domain-containing protein 2 [Daldinia childiae]KAF3058231.1 Zinc finger MIZ domain-containing protein 2 [Daldinia childiae]